MIQIIVQDKKVPALGYGTYKLRGDECIASVGKALEIGYRHIDTAQIYENEAEVGAGIKASGVRREDIFLTTKIWIEEISKGNIPGSVDESLKKLKVEHVDLLLIHWPVTDISFSDQMKILQQIQKEGRATLIGVSNYTVAQMKEVVETIGANVVTNQVEYHPYLSQEKLLEYIRAHNMFLTAYCPLAQGRIANDAVLAKIGKKYGKTVGQVALRWLVQQERVAAIPKAGSEKHIRENFDIFDFKLELAEMNEISALARADGRIVNPNFAPVWDKAA